MLIAAALLLAAAPQAATAAASADGEKRVCRMEPDTSSRIPRRICHTAAEWSAIARAARDDAERNQRYRNSTQVNPG